MKKSSGFKMKNPAIGKIAKKAGDNRQPKREPKPKKPVDQGKKAKKRVRPPQPPKPGTVKGITKFAYDMKDITSVGNKHLGKLRGKVRDKIKDYFFTK
tara:strand:+ start:655 stop:948 length:294 start_codon:yes stop_codon:yes gene_type:complete